MAKATNKLDSSANTTNTGIEPAFSDEDYDDAREDGFDGDGSGEEGSAWDEGDDDIDDGSESGSDDDSGDDDEGDELDSDDDESEGDGEEADPDDSPDVARAKELGFTEKEIKAMRGEKNLTAVIVAMDRKIAEFGRTGGDATNTADKSKTVGETSTGKTKESEPAATGDEADLELDPELFDDRLIKAFKSQGKKYSAAIEGMKQQVAVLQDALSDRVFDEQVNGLGKGFDSILGAGSTSAQPENSKFAKNRSAVKDEMKALSAGYKAIGKNAPSESQLFSRAVQSLFSDKIQGMAKKGITDQLRGKSKRFISRPASRRQSTDGRSPTQRAVDNVKEKLRQSGGHSSDFEE